MKNTGKLKLFALLAIFACTLMVFPAPADARDRDRDRGRRGHDRREYYHHRHFPYGSIQFSLPRGFVEIGFGKHKYYYHSGLFYLQNQSQYVVVPPPTGVVVYQIPSGWNTVVIDGVTYYVYNGVYYSRVPQGYKVVQPPEQVVVEPATVAVDDGPGQAQQEFTINIPNNKGGYVAVVIKRSGTGFVGPQGEYYPEFPQVAQLQLMYAK